MKTTNPSKAKLSQTYVKNLFKRARRALKHPGLDLLVAPTSEAKGELIIVTPARIGIAVDRNTIRRRIKALFHVHALDQKGFDSIFIIKKEGIWLSYDQLEKIIIYAFTQLSSKNNE